MHGPHDLAAIVRENERHDEDFYADPAGQEPAIDGPYLSAVRTLLDPMTNARVSRKQNAAMDRLIAERNALLDVLNGILNAHGTMVDGRMVILIPHEATLGKPRCVVDALPSPKGTIVRLNPDLAVTGEGKSLFVVPVEGRA